MKIETEFTRMMGIDLPIIAAPMFLVSNVEMVVRAAESGGIGTFPSLNYRPIDAYAGALKDIRQRTNRPIGVNIIVNKSNTRQGDDVRIALDNGVNLFITSLGNPKTVIQEAHRQGAKVLCDVTNLDHALKVEDMGADGVIAVGSGAGGHAGPLSLLVLVPWLKSRLRIPIIAAGGVANGAQMASLLAVGASGVSVGTRFIACIEASVGAEYKDAVVRSTPEDILLTDRISGTPASVIRTPYTEKLGDLPWALKVLKSHPATKKFVVPLIHLAGMKTLESAVEKPTWKSVWSAGQSAGLIDDVVPMAEIFDRFVREYAEAVARLPAPR